MSDLCTAFIPFSDIERIQIYINTGMRQTVANIKEATGADYILNGTLYNMSTGEAVCHLKADGEVFCAPEYNTEGYAWDNPGNFGMELLPNIPLNGDTGKTNFIACDQLIPTLNPYIGEDRKGSRGRSAIGIKGGCLALYCSKDGTSAARTPAALRDDLLAAGWDSAIMLDGGGSAQCDFLGDTVTSPIGRKVPHLILVYLKKSHHLLNNAASLDYASALAPFTGVKLWYNDDSCYFAGDETGRVLEADCPWATKAMAESVLASVRGFKYQPFEAGSALLGPEAELGDGVGIGGVYGPLASINTTFGAMCTSDIGAPSDEEVDHEYPFLTKQERELSRKVALGKTYYGTRITRQNGLEIIKTAADGTETGTRVLLNSETLAFYDDNGEVALYFDTEAGKYRFRGDVEITGGTMNVNDNFIVDAEGNLTINGNIDLSNGHITWGGNAPGGGGGSGNDPEAYLKSIGITYIDRLKIQSPLIEGAEIRGADIMGGRFCSLEKSAHIEMNAENAAGTRYSQLDFYSGDTRVFNIDSKNSLSSLDPSAAGSSTVTMNTVNGTLLQAKTIFDGAEWRSGIYPYGSWDFSNANVTLKEPTKLLNVEGVETGWVGSCTGEAKVEADGTVTKTDTLAVALSSKITEMTSDGKLDANGRYVMVSTDGVKLYSGQNTRITLTDKQISVRALNGATMLLNGSKVITEDMLRSYGLIP